MKKAGFRAILIHSLLALFIASCPSYASEQEPPSYAFSLNHGTKYEEFYWTISGNPTPNILSELEWRDMELQHTQLSLAASQANFITRFEFDYGSINSGENQDSDYSGNNRTQEWSRSLADVSGETIGINLLMGYEFPLTPTDRFLLTPMFGFYKYEQRLGMLNGTKVINGFDTNSNSSITSDIPLVGLDSSYDTNWNTKWLGAEFTWNLHDRISLVFQHEYHFDIDFSATANWNLRSNLEHPVSFTHDADEGEGHRISFSVHYQILPSMKINAFYDYYQIEVTDGLDRTYFSDNTEGTTRLNIAETESSSFRIGLSWTPGASDKD